MRQKFLVVGFLIGVTFFLGRSGMAQESGIQITDFEDAAGWTVGSWLVPVEPAIQLPAPTIEASAEQVKSGKKSLKLTYHYAVPDRREDTYLSVPATLPGKPTKVALWVYGNGKNHALALYSTDSDGEHFCGLEIPITWEGWKEVTFNLEEYSHFFGGTGAGAKGKVDYPIKELGFLVHDSDTSTDTGTGVLYFDDMRILESLPSGPASSNLREPSGCCPETSKPPVIDGKLDDAAWQQAALFTDFRPFSGIPVSPMKTDAYLIRDKDYLYVGFRCEEKLMGHLQGTVREKDKYEDNEDLVEVVIDPGTKGKQGLHIIVNAQNSIYDERITEGAFDVNFNSNLKTAVGQEKNAWICEMRIPFTDLTETPVRNGDVWGINFCRGRAAHIVKEGELSESTNWSGKGFRQLSSCAPVCFVEQGVQARLNIPDTLLLGPNAAKATLSTQFLGGKPLNVNFMHWEPDGKLIPTIRPANGLEETFDFNIAKRGEHAFALQVTDSKNNLLTQTLPIVKDVKKLLQLETNGLAFYPSDKEVTVRVQIDLDDIARAGKELRIECRNRNKIIDRIKTDYLPDSIYRAIYNLADMPENHYTIQAWLREGGNILDESIVEFDVIEPVYQKIEPIKKVELDVNKYVRVNGRPFVPIGLWWTGDASTHYSIWEYYGFNFVNAGPGSNTEDSKSQLDAVWKYHLYAYLTVSPAGYGHPDYRKPEFYNYTLGAFHALKDHPGILCYSLGDEVYPSSVLDEGGPMAPVIPKYVELYNIMRQEDPKRLSAMSTSSNVLGRSQEIRDMTTYCDLLGLDIYAVGRLPMSSYSEGARFFQKVLADTPNNNFLFIGQANTYREGGYRWPTPEEIRLQMYLQFFHGACGVGWYKYGRTGMTDDWETKWLPPGSEHGLRDRPLLLSYFKRLNTEVSFLAPVICSETLKDKVKVSASEPLETWVKEYQGNTYLFIANVEPQFLPEVEIQYSGETKNGQAEVIYEFRKVEVKNSKIRDIFKPYEVHIYKLP